MSAHLTAAERAYDRLKDDILNGVLPVGPLDIRRLGDRLRMSATPVREALARLSAERLVKREAHGYSIALLSPRRLEQLYEVSGALLDLAIDSARRTRWARPHGTLQASMSRYAEDLSALLNEIAAGQTNTELSAYVDDITARLFPGRRSEAVVFANAMEDLALLRSLWDKRDHEGVRVFLRAYHEARIGQVDAIARQLASQAGDP